MSDIILLLGLAYLFMKGQDEDPQPYQPYSSWDPVVNITVEGYTSPDPGIEPTDYVERTRFKNGKGKNKNGRGNGYIPVPRPDPIITTPLLIPAFTGEVEEYRESLRAKPTRKKVSADYTVEQYREEQR